MSWYFNLEFCMDSMQKYPKFYPSVGKMFLFVDHRNQFKLRFKKSWNYIIIYILISFTNYFLEFSFFHRILETVDSQTSAENRMRSSQESLENEDGNNSEEGGDNDVDEDEIRKHINSNNIRIMNWSRKRIPRNQKTAVFYDVHIWDRRMFIISYQIS